MKLTNAVCSTCLRRVQFGVPPNCSNPWLLHISGATPETIRGTRVLQYSSLRLGVLAVQRS